MPDIADQFTELMLANAALHRALLAAGESIAEAAGQTHARSTCLQQVAAEPLTVATIAARLGMARQSVQRLADILVADGLAAYKDNPRHPRAHLRSGRGNSERSELCGGDGVGWRPRQSSGRVQCAVACMPMVREVRMSVAEQRWEFEDDRQRHVALANRPARVLAYAQATQTLVRLGVPVVGYFGSQHHADSSAHPAAAGLDVPSVGSGDAIDLDLITTLRPDLVVSVTYAGEAYGLPETVAAKLADTTPVLLIGIAGDRTLETVIARFHQLAQALSATPNAPDAEPDLTAALATLTSAASQHPTLRVTALSGGTNTDAYVASPSYWPSLRLLADAGITFTQTATTGGWEVVPWTDLPTRHPADIVLYDQRPNSLPTETLTTIPAWSQLPAVTAGNILPWNPEPPLTYETAANFTNTLTNAYRR